MEVLHTRVFFSFFDARRHRAPLSYLGGFPHAAFSCQLANDHSNDTTYFYSHDVSIVIGDWTQTCRKCFFIVLSGLHTCSCLV